MIPVKNVSKSMMFVGGVMISPGETRYFEDHQLPPEYRQPEATCESRLEDDPLMLISALSVGKLEQGLPDLSEDELLRLEDLEKAKDKPRQGALAVILAERLRRAEQVAPGGLTPEGTDEAGDLVAGGEGGEG